VLYHKKQHTKDDVSGSWKTRGSEGTRLALLAPHKPRDTCTHPVHFSALLPRVHRYSSRSHLVVVAIPPDWQVWSVRMWPEAPSVKRRARACVGRPRRKGEKAQKQRASGRVAPGEDEAQRRQGILRQSRAGNIINTPWVRTDRLFPAPVSTSS